MRFRSLLLNLAWLPLLPALYVLSLGPLARQYNHRPDHEIPKWVKLYCTPDDYVFDYLPEPMLDACDAYFELWMDD